MNVIAHHLNEIYTKIDLWPNKNKWQHLLDSPEILPTQQNINKLPRKLLINTQEWDSFLNSEWKQLNWYKEAGMFGDLIPAEGQRIDTALPWV